MLFTEKEELRVKSVPGVSPRSFPIASTGNTGGYSDRENWSVTQIPAPPAPLFGALVRIRGTAALPTTWPSSPAGLLPASLGPAARLQAPQPSAWFSLDISWCCDTAFSRGLLSTDEILGSRRAKLARWGLFSLISSFCQNYT